MEIRIDNLTRPEIQALLEDYLKFIYAISPPKRVHALNLDELRQPENTFQVAWKENDWMGAAHYLPDKSSMLK